MFQAGPLYLENLNAKEDIVINQGGTSSGKTYSILQSLFSIAISEIAEITVLGQDLPNLKVGAIRDAKNIVSSSRELQSCLSRPYHQTENMFLFNSGSFMEFKSYKDAQDAKSGKRDYLFCNEANGILHSIFNEMHLRTRKRTYIDYNPNAGFWAHEMYIGHPGVKLIISDHRHNPFLDQKVRDKIESLKFKDQELYRVYARGLTGKIEGLIYRNWEWCDSIPDGAKFLGTGLDFGFTNDVTAVADVYLNNGELWLNEVLYERGLLNVPVAGATYVPPNISDRLKELEHERSKEIIADSAEKKSIAELSVAGWKMTEAEKPAHSVIDGINIIKKYKINVTRTSVNIGKELNSYKWKTNKSGDPENEPVDAMNHALDAVRYVALKKLKPIPNGQYNII